MGLIKGKQLADAPNGVPSAKINTGAVTTAKLNINADVPFGGNKITGLADGLAPTDGVTVQQLNAAIVGFDWKDAAKLGTSSNISLVVAPALIDGLAPGVGARILVKAQTLPEENGIYIWNGAGIAMTRSPDANTAALLENATLDVDQGTQTGIWHQTEIIATINVDPVQFVELSTSAPTKPTNADKDLTPLATVGNGATTGLAASLTSVGYSMVFVNGVEYEVGNAVTTKDCYWSTDGGATPLSNVNVPAGATLYWNGIISGFNIEITDKVDFKYNV